MKTENQEMIQQLMDEGEYSPLYPFVLQSNLSDFQKILISIMLNDIRMNGSITWKHQTYADKLLKSRKGIWDQFRILNECGIIIPMEDNKAGSKSNKFTISFSAISDYKPVTRKKKPVTGENKPVTGESKPVTGESKPVTGESKPVTPGLHIKKLKEINKETNKENKKILKTSDDKAIVLNTSFLVIEDEPIDDYLASLETQASFKTNDIKEANQLALQNVKTKEHDLAYF